jgi:hypothetical protein
VVSKAKEKIIKIAVYMHDEASELEHMNESEKSFVEK